MLKDTLQRDLNAALKVKDELKRVVLGSLLASLRNKEIEKRTKLSKIIQEQAELEAQSTLSDDEAIAVIASEIKKRKEAIEQYRVARRAELADKEQRELEILSSYLPEQLSEEEIRRAVNEAISELGVEKAIKNMGKVMGKVMERVKGKAEGGLVSRIVKEELT